MALKSTQKVFYALDLSEKSFVPSTDDGINLKRLPIEDASKTTAFKYLASTYDFESQMIRDGVMGKGKKIITFSQILNYNIFPLAEILRELLEIGQKEMSNPVEIEFAVNLESKQSGKVFFNALQIRPIVDNDQAQGFQLDEIDEEKAIIISDSAMGNGIVSDFYDIIYIKPASFNPALTMKIAVDIEKINSRFQKENKNYVLIGPGRWGSQDSWLGIPVKWPQISQAKVIVESGLENFRVDPSQGSHFFQNLTAFRVGYFTINPFINDGYFDIEYLNELEPEYEDGIIRHVRFEDPLVIRIDGRHNKGVVLRPDALITQID